LKCSIDLNLKCSKINFVKERVFLAGNRPPYNVKYFITAMPKPKLIFNLEFSREGKQESILDNGIMASFVIRRKWGV
jgi:hypothetical protein